MSKSITVRELLSDMDSFQKCFLLSRKRAVSLVSFFYYIKDRIGHFSISTPSTLRIRTHQQYGALSSEFLQYFYEYVAPVTYLPLWLRHLSGRSPGLSHCLCLPVVWSLEWMYHSGTSLQSALRQSKPLHLFGTSCIITHPTNQIVKEERTQLTQPFPGFLR